MDSSEIAISPPQAKVDGCGASATIVEQYDNRPEYDIWYKWYRFHATAAQGWRFDHWVQYYSYVDTDPSGTTATGATTISGANPWQGGGYVEVGTDEWEDGSWISLGYRRGYRLILSLTAVFVKEHEYTGLILHSPNNLQILHGQGGTILRDN